MRARFPAYTDVRSENLRSPLANPQDGMSGGRGSGVRFFRLPFFSQKKKGDPSAGWRTEPAQDARDAV